MACWMMVTVIKLESWIPLPAIQLIRTENELSVFLGKCSLEVFHQILMKVSCLKTEQTMFGGRNKNRSWKTWLCSKKKASHQNNVVQKAVTTCSLCMLMGVLSLVSSFLVLGWCSCFWFCTCRFELHVMPGVHVSAYPAYSFQTHLSPLLSEPALFCSNRNFPFVNEFRILFYYYLKSSAVI